VTQALVQINEHGSDSLEIYIVKEVVAAAFCIGLDRAL
jgi:hypothetical protein